MLSQRMKKNQSFITAYKQKNLSSICQISGIITQRKDELQVTLKKTWKRHVYPDVHCSTIYKSQEMEAT